MDKRPAPKIRKAARKEPRRRWGSHENAAPDEARVRITAAARACYTRHGIAETTMADVASEAKVVRATLYRYFPNRESVLLAVFREEVRDFLERFRTQVGEAETFSDFLLDYLVFAVRQSATTPMHRDFFAEQSALWVSRNYLGDPESLGLTIDFFRESFQVARRTGEIRNDLDLGELIEFAARLLMSFMLVPNAGQKSEAGLRAYFEKHFVRALLQPRPRLPKP